MEFRILGPLEVVTAVGPVELPASKQRALLTILLLRANAVVARDELVELLWAGSPPASAPELVKVYVSRLRKALGADTGRLRTRAPGYALLVEEGELDSATFERLLADGRAALARGSAARARRLLVEALTHWRGPALADFRYDDFAQRDAQRLEELRLEALEARLEADLALGRHEDVLGELSALAQRHPGREQLQRQAMLALYRAGRQEEALDWFRRLRRSLLDEFGLEPSGELRRLQQEILAHDPSLVAPPRRAAANLPAAVTPLVGRDGEVRALVELLRSGERRLVAVTGAGGSGKTALALAAARAVADDFPDGAFLVELAGVRDEVLVAAAVAASLGLEPADGGATTEASLAEALSGRELLLVLDNFEQIRAAAPLLARLLRAAARLQLLVTSRVVLHVSGETVFPLGPLEAEAAAALFVARAEAAAPGAVAEGDDALVEEICRRLDRLPLALELAAPRLRTLALQQLAARLEHVLPLLADGARDLPARQQTLRATIDWSVELLGDDSRRLLAQLGVFAGGFTIDAIEAVCADGAASLVAEVAELVDASLVRLHAGGRLHMLETVRERAAELLDATGEARAGAARHAEWVLALARSANLTIEAAGEMRHALVLPEWDNVRAALTWSVEHDPQLGLELAFALENYWVTAAQFEGRRWLELLLARAGDLHDDLRARALRTYGNILLVSGEPDAGAAAYDESLEAYRRLRDERGIGVMLQRLAIQALRRGRLEQAHAMCEASLRLHAKAGFAKGESVALGVLARVERESGDAERALELYERSAALAEQSGFVWYRVGALLGLAQVLLERGAPAEAERRLRPAVPLVAAMGDRRQALAVLASFARAAIASGRLEQAGLLWGAVEAEESRAPLGDWEPLRERYAGSTLEQQGAEFETGRAEGRRLSLGQALEAALDRD